MIRLCTLLCRRSASDARILMSECGSDVDESLTVRLACCSFLKVCKDQLQGQVDAMAATGGTQSVVYALCKAPGQHGLQLRWQAGYGQVEQSQQQVSKVSSR